VLRDWFQKFRIRLPLRGEPGDVLLAESLLPGTQGVGTDHRALAFHDVADLGAYQAYAHAAELAHRRRRQVEVVLARSQRPFRYRGFNALIGGPVSFSVDYKYGPSTLDGLAVPNYRERLVCSRTGLNARTRGVLLALKHLLGPVELASRRLYLAEQASRLYQYLCHLHPGVIGSEYLGPEMAPGAMRGGIRHEDLTRLSFRDGSLDVAIANDVLEHIPDHQAALGELARVVAPGGLALLTVPFVRHRQAHQVRARIRPDGSLEHLLPPSYHGDPVNPAGGILSYRDYGWSLLDELRAAGFRRAGGLLFWSMHQGLMGDQDLLVLYARR